MGLCPSQPVTRHEGLSITGCNRAKSPSRPGWWFCSAFWEKRSLCPQQGGTWGAQMVCPCLGFQGRKVPHFRLVHPKPWRPVWIPAGPCPRGRRALLELWSLGLCRQAGVWKGSEVVWNFLEYCRMSAVSYKMQLFYLLSLHIYHVAVSFRKTSHHAGMSLLCREPGGHLSTALCSKDTKC